MHLFLPEERVSSISRGHVFATHLGGFLDLEFSKRASFFGRFSTRRVGLAKIGKNPLKRGRFLPEFIIRMGTKADFRNEKWIDFWRPGGKPLSTHRFCTPLAFYFLFKCLLYILFCTIFLKWFISFFSQCAPDISYCKRVVFIITKISSLPKSKDHFVCWDMSKFSYQNDKLWN